MVIKLRPRKTPPPQLVVLDMQLQKTLQDRRQDVPQNTAHDIDDQQTDFVNGIKDLTSDSKPDVQNSTGILAPPADVPEEKAKEKMGQEDKQQC